MVNLNKAVFLDRDGVLVKSLIKNKKGYAPKNLKDFKVYKESKNSVEILNSLGFKIFVVTNQPDVGKKIISKKTLNKMHKILKKKVKIKKIYTYLYILVYIHQMKIVLVENQWLACCLMRQKFSKSI